MPHCGRGLAGGGQRVRGPLGRPGGLPQVRLRLRPPGRLWRADHLREEHAAVVSGPGLLRLPPQLQLDRHAPQEEAHSHSSQCVRGVQPSSELRLRVGAAALQLLLRSRRLARHAHRGGNDRGARAAGANCSCLVRSDPGCSRGFSPAGEHRHPQHRQVPRGRLLWRLEHHSGDRAGKPLLNHACVF